MTHANTLDLEQCLHQAQAGDSSALGRLLESYQGYLLLLAGVQIGRRLQGKVEPADLVQETFLEAHRHFTRFRGHSEGEFVNWLRQIQTGTCANLVRHYLGTRRRDIRLERDLAVELDCSSQVRDGALLAKGSSPSQGAARREQAGLLAEALKRLPSDCRDVIALRHLEGLTFAEVAGRMGRSIDVVKKLWPRALARLRDALGGCA
jgi:RNA polymerase sigma-70 factor (ECF subfamily)